MGLDIHGYGILTEVPDGDNDPDGYDFIAFDNPDFPGRCEGLKDGMFYRAGADAHAPSMSYGSYNRWREQLAELAGYPRVSVRGEREPRHTLGAYAKGSGPFYELVWFSDCEGTLGPAVCAKLAADFGRFVPAAAAKGGAFYATYIHLHTVFTNASMGGAVQFG